LGFQRHAKSEHHEDKAKEKRKFMSISCLHRRCRQVFR
jgi:hypothetical protein